MSSLIRCGWVPTQERRANSQAVTSPISHSSLGTGLGREATNKGGFFLFHVVSRPHARPQRLQLRPGKYKTTQVILSAPQGRPSAAHIQPRQRGHGVLCPTSPNSHTLTPLLPRGPGDSPSHHIRGQAPPLTPIAKIAASYWVIGWQQESRVLHAHARFRALTPHVVLSHLQTRGCIQSLGPAKLPTTKIVQGAALLPCGSPGPWDQTMRVRQGENIRASC